MITAYSYVIINVLGWALAIFWSPFWGLLVYVNIYFNPPIPWLNWWAGYVPEIRWSLYTIVVLIISIIIHRDKLSPRALGNAWWPMVFFGLNLVITTLWAVNHDDAVNYTQMLLAFCFASYFIVRTIRDQKDLRLFFLVIIGFATQLSLRAYLHGKRIHGRLELNGTSDAFGSNEFALLLAGILPLMIPFILKGKWYERFICILALPFIANAFILCNSRGAVVAMVLSAFLVMVFFPDRKIRKGMVIAAICAIPLFLYLADPEFIERLSTLKGSSNISMNSSVTNELSSGRVEIWKYGLNMVNDHPMGAGPNAFKYLAKFYMPAEMLSYHGGDDGPGVRAAHNTYLQVLVEQGYLGLILFVTMCIKVLLLLRRTMYEMKRRADTNRFWFYCILAWSLSFFSILLGGMFNSRFYYEFFWWQIALIVVTCSCLKSVEGEQQVNQPVPSS